MTSPLPLERPGRSRRGGRGSSGGARAWRWAELAHRRRALHGISTTAHEGRWARGTVDDFRPGFRSSASHLGAGHISHSGNGTVSTRIFAGFRLAPVKIRRSNGPRSASRRRRGLRKDEGRGARGAGSGRGREWPGEAGSKEAAHGRCCASSRARFGIRRSMFGPVRERDSGDERCSSAVRIRRRRSGIGEGKVGRIRDWRRASARSRRSPPLRFQRLQGCERQGGFRFSVAIDHRGRGGLDRRGLLDRIPVTGSTRDRGPSKYVRRVCQKPRVWGRSSPPCV